MKTNDERTEEHTAIVESQKGTKLQVTDEVHIYPSGINANDKALKNPILFP
uniref:Uncharacterized protein n=1 Tax=Lepeophtheirus salmonis TaxID=72036 RepID=A0A0K2VA17_LEPSM